MMRSFSSRSDTFVSDEPFYGAYLKATGDAQPMADEIIGDMDCDWQSITETMRGPVPHNKPVWYQKHMPHHMEGPVDIAALPDHRHAFLIRDPIRVAASYANKRTEINADHLGIRRQRIYFERISDQTGAAPPIVDSARILDNPKAILTQLCDAIGIAWEEAMLGWGAGPYPEDGIWGSHWYDKVNASTGFDAGAGALPTLKNEYAAIAQECREDYEFLLKRALK